MPISLRTLCLVTAVLCYVQRSLEHGTPRRSFLSRRAIDGTRGRKYFDPSEEGAFDSYGSAGGQYDPFDHATDLSDIRKNVPGEPGVDYPAYTTLPQTGFTCEGRSRGYYADEAAGCQVFHVCHDVLVSSFLCPIGSTFSQKLLTCDWWTKVDCSTTNRYLEVNHNSYQIDDDEMIRNAYAMISLQSAEDVTKDGLVDPDSGARIVDYSALGGRTIGYTSGLRRITDYPSVDATGNDLPNGFEDYSHQHDRRILDYDRYQQRTAKTSAAYQGKYHLEDKGRSPYHASPIIRHDYQDRSGDNEFQDGYRRSDGFTNRLQTSYAPTVPTVTTTTRRLYSPTVPTTYRPSTLAYSKLDLLMDSSDHLYAHSKSLGSLTTPPTIIPPDDDLKNIDSSVSETQRDDLKKSESVSSPEPDRFDRTDARVRSKDDEARLSFEEKSNTNFRINVTDTIDEDEVFRQQNDRPVIRDDSEESSEDIETKDSIGIARALNNPGWISARDQDQVSKGERRNPTTPSPSLTNPERPPQSYAANSTQTLKKTNVLAINETSNDRSTENYEGIANSTASSFEETTYTRIFSVRTTPLLPNGNRQRNSDDSVQPSTISITTEPTTRGSFEKTYRGSVDRPSNDGRPTVDQNSSSSRSVSSFNDESVSGTNLGFEIPQLAQFLEPPLDSFLINVPEETRYTTIDEDSETFWNPGTTTTEISRFSNTPSGTNPVESPVYNENHDEQPLIDYADDGLSETPNLGVHFTDRVITEVPTPIPWLVSSWHDRSIVNVPVTEVVPPIVDYNDGFGDFVPPGRDAYEHSYATELGHTESKRTQKSPTTPRNDSETEILNRYNTGFEFTIRDAIKAQLESRVDHKSPCYSATSDKQTGPCGTSSVAPRVVVSTPSAREKTVSIGIKGTTESPEQLITSGNTGSPEKSVTPSLKEFPTSITQSSITISANIDREGSALKMVTPRDVTQIEELDKIERTVETTTANSLPYTIRPGSLKQIEEAIDRQNSPYQVSLTVKKNEDLGTTADDFITRLITQPTSVLKEHLDDFEIIKSVEPEDEVAPISQQSKFPDTDHTSPSENNNSFIIATNDTAGQFEEPNSNVSMLSLLQLMAELLKLDRLPRPFSAKDLRNVELETSLNLDLDEAPFVTTSSLFDRSQTRTPFRYTNTKVPAYDTSKTTANVAEPGLSLNSGQNKPSFIIASPLPDHSKARLSFGNANSKPSILDTLKRTANVAEPETSLNLGQNKPSFVTATTLLDHSNTGTPFRNANTKVPSFDDISKIPSNLALKSPADISSRIHPDHATEPKTGRSKSEDKIARPLQKQEILEQLTENFGQPLYRVTPIHRSIVFDLPQVQRNLDFETGLPIIDESKRVTSETEEEEPAPSTTKLTAATTTTATTTTTTTMTTTTTQKTTAETEKTVVETEFVPSIGFSFDTNEGREEYVEAILGGLIDNHAGDNDGNESGIERSTDGPPKNETLRAEQQGSKDV